MGVWKYNPSFVTLETDFFYKTGSLRKSNQMVEIFAFSYNVNINRVVAILKSECIHISRESEWDIDFPGVYMSVITEEQNTIPSAIGYEVDLIFSTELLKRRDYHINIIFINKIIKLREVNKFNDPDELRLHLWDEGYVQKYVKHPELIPEQIYEPPFR